MKRLVIALIVVAIALVIFTAWWKISLSGVSPSDQKLQTFTIARGDGVREIAKKLHDQGLIRDQVVFFLLVKKEGLEKNIQAGSFELSPAMNLYDLTQKLTVGTEDVWVTIPEGWRSEEILEYLEKQGFNTVGLSWKTDEGKLFPDTYRVPKQITTEEIHQLLKKTFIKKVDNVSDQNLILASLVEREAKKESDRPLVASVLKNRLDAGMALDVDATIQYILGKPGNWWPKEVLLDDLKIKSPYNTYLNSGLPPGPICNPGLSSIKAALSPAQTDYLYYLSDKSGTIHFAKTLQEHNSNVAKYLNQ